MFLGSNKRPTMLKLDLNFPKPRRGIKARPLDPCETQDVNIC